MAFETGVSTSPSNLLSSLETRLNTDGWTIVRNNGQAESGSSNQLSVSDPGIAEGNQYNIVAFDSPAATARWELQPSTGDSGAGANFYAHTGSPDNSGNLGTYVVFGNGPSSTTDQGFSGSSVAYFFFSGTTPSGARYCHIVLEGTAGVYWHCFFGTVEKSGTYTGGQYASATITRESAVGLIWPFQFNPAPQQGQQWFRFDNFASSGSPGWRALNGFVSNQGLSTPLALLYQGGLNDIAQRTPFAPILVPFWETNNPIQSSSRWVLAGHLPDAMQVSMDGRDAGEVITLGTDDWHLFPAHRKTVDGVSTTSSAYSNTSVAGPAPNNDSNLQGYAYREP